MVRRHWKDLGFANQLKEAVHSRGSFLTYMGWFLLFKSLLSLKNTPNKKVNKLPKHFWIIYNIHTTVFRVNCCFKRRRNCSQATQTPCTVSAIGWKSREERREKRVKSAENSTKEAGTARGLVQLKKERQKLKETRQVKWEKTSPEVGETE